MEISNKLKKSFIGNEENIIQKNFIWNMIGSITYALPSIILLICVTRILGVVEGGVFSIALTTGQLMLTIALYEMRPYQVTDTVNRYSFEQYYTARLITSVFMLVGSYLYIRISGYSGEKAIVVWLICCYKMIDGLADIFEGMFQRKGRLDLAGKSLTFRSAFSMIFFVIALIICKSLIISSMVLVITSGIGYILFDILIGKEFILVKLSRDISAVQDLLKTCFPLFICSFLEIYIFSAAKYAIDKNMAQEFQTYFSVIFVPTSTINLFCGFVLKPLLTTLAANWSEKDFKKYKKTFVSVNVYIAVFTVICLCGAYLVGIPVLSFLYNINLSPYLPHLLIILVGGGLNAISTVIYYSLMVMRKRQSIFIGYFITFILAMLLPNVFVKESGLMGAAVVYLVLMLIKCIIFTTLEYINYKKIAER